MSSYYLKFKQKRSVLKLFKLVDVYEIYGPVDEYFEGSGNPFDYGETRTCTKKLGSFNTKELAMETLQKYRTVNE